MPRDRTGLTRVVLSLAVPLMAANLSQTLLTLVDTAMIGRLGETPLAAMGPASVVYLVVFLILSSVFMGVQILTARRFGEGDLAACGIVFNGGLVLATLIGLAGGALGVFVAGPLAMYLAGDTAVGTLCGDYLRIRWGGVVFICVLWAFKGFYIGVGITKLDMVVALGANLLNVLLNWMFLWGNLGAPEMGMPGAGLASLIATAFAVLAYVLHAIRPAVRERFGLFRLGGTSAEIMRRILGLSGARAVQAAAFGGSILFFKFIGDACGNTALAASTIVWRYLGFTVLAALALGAASATLVGQALGAGDPERAAMSARRASILAAALNVVMAIIVLAIPRAIIGLFTTDPAVIEVAVGPMRFMAVAQIIDGPAIVLSRSLSGAGCTVYVMVSEIFVSLGCMVPAAWLLTTYFSDDLTLVWAAWLVYVVMWFVFMATKFAAGGWKSVEV